MTQPTQSKHIFFTTQMIQIVLLFNDTKQRRHHLVNTDPIAPFNKAHTGIFHH